MELKGKIILDLPLQEGISKAGNPWKKKEWVLETTDTQYPKKVKFHVFGDRVDSIRLEAGKTYTLQVDVESREFNGRWYTDVNCYSAAEDLPAAPVFTPPAGMEPAANYGAPDFSKGDDESDLPF